MHSAPPRDALVIEALLGPELRAVREHLERRVFERGAILVREGEVWPGMDIIAAGRVALIRCTARREQVLGILRTGSVLDIAPLALCDERCWFTARAVEAGVLYRLDAQRARELIATQPAFQRFAGRAMAAQLARLARLVHDLAFKDVLERLATWLADEAAATPPTASGEIVVARDLSLRELASLLGTGREVVSRSLRRLVRSGIIRLEPGRIVIIDRQQLEALARRT